MSLVPAFDIGVWNVWILMVAWVFFHVTPLNWLIFRHDIKAMFKKGGASPPYKKTEKLFSNLSTLVGIILFIYSVSLPLPLGTPLFYAGITLFVVGIIIFEIAEIFWAKASIDEPITKGIYRYSRHPIYLAVFMQFIGIGIASASGLFLLITVVSIILSILTTPAEERFCLEKYGNAYREYMNRTPRWIGLPKTLKT